MTHRTSVVKTGVPYFSLTLANLAGMALSKLQARRCRVDSRIDCAMTMKQADMRLIAMRKVTMLFPYMYCKIEVRRLVPPKGAVEGLFTTRYPTLPAKSEPSTK
jgi:hypothetical protein